jgi:hypothetical protein
MRFSGCGLKGPIRQFEWIAVRESAVLTGIFRLADETADSSSLEAKG